MAESDADKKFSSDSELYFKIGYLLQKKRPPELQVLVQKILDSNINVKDKYKKIEEIDSPLFLKNNPVINNKEVSELLQIKDIKPKDTIQKNIILIKQIFKKNQFFHYLFKDYIKIKRFGDQSRMILAGIFKIQLIVPKSFLTSMINDSKTLIPYLEFVLDAGWTILEKQEYNLLLQFLRLCEEINNSNLNNNDTPNIFLGKIKSIETRFLVCHYKQEYPDAIVSNIRYVMKSFQKEDEKIELVEMLTKKILMQVWDSRCLFNLILAINMAVYRKYFSIRELLVEKTGGVINKFDFDCSEDIKVKIAAYITENDQRLQELARVRFEISKMNQFLRQFVQKDSANKDNYDFSYLIHFYESGVGPDKYHFNRDKENIYIFTNNLMKRFIIEFESFLCGKIKIEEWGIINIFTMDFFHHEISRLQTYYQRLTRMNIGILGFTNERFWEIKKDPEHSRTSREELMVIQIIDELSDLMVDLAKKLGFLTQNYKVNPNLNLNEIEFKPIDPSVLMSSGYFVPFWDKIIILPIFFANKPFGEALSSFTSLCFLISMFYQNSKIILLLEREIKILDEIHKIKTNIERIADAITYERIRQSYFI